MVPAPVSSLLDRDLLVVTGKGGVGKSTIAAALGLLAARRGLRTIVVEVGSQRHLPALFDHAEPAKSGEELELAEGLWSLSIDPDRVLAQWLRTLGGRVPARVLLSSSSFQYFVAAAPGGREMLCMVKVLECSERYDLTILDAPATGHALAMLRSPQTFAAIARVGPIAAQSHAVAALLADPARTGLLAVAQGSELAVAETLDLQRGLREELARELDAVLVNGMLPRRFAAAELMRAARLGADHAVMHAATRAAHALHARARFQQNQIARLRRRELRVLSIPFIFQAELDLQALERIAARLEREL